MPTIIRRTPFLVDPGVSSRHQDPGRGFGAVGQAAAVSMWIRTPIRCHSGCGCSVCGSNHHKSSGYWAPGLPPPIDGAVVARAGLGGSVRAPTSGTGCCCAAASLVWALAPCVSGVWLSIKCRVCRQVMGNSIVCLLVWLALVSQTGCNRHYSGGLDPSKQPLCALLGAACVCRMWDIHVSGRDTVPNSG